ncbi:EamA family transporter [Deinococcus yavapaiensis]|uniref:EamA-like transporter family protein n=1 Tax=Deinococcus yavapaiensis KR-236 TaxID=694435 RepID=A0A318S3N4_9DEIO|nr:EamA family transporter [Deinococcus yavapaiensis]PYE49375.1 EamA-like transporter family protein [Deinococcus yavapaiensis KR-236]
MNDVAIVLLAGLGAAVSFGSGDFSGGVATKRDPVVRVVALAHVLSFVAFALLAVLTRERAPSLADLAWGALAGVGGLIGLASLYRGLALGPMGVVAATSAVLAAAVPVLVSVALGQVLGFVQLVGMILALVGVVVLTRDASTGRGGVLLAVSAGLGFGAFFVFLGQTTPGSVFWPLVVARFVSGSVMLVLAVRGSGLKPAAPNPIVASSVLDALGNVLFVLAAQTGRLAEASVLSNVYPAFTVLLAWAVLKERLRRDQWWGLAVTLIAVPLVAWRT